MSYQKLRGFLSIHNGIGLFRRQYKCRPLMSTVQYTNRVGNYLARIFVTRNRS